jgi:hypothetical protein
MGRRHRPGRVGADDEGTPRPLAPWFPMFLAVAIILILAVVVLWILDHATWLLGILLAAYIVQAWRQDRRPRGP